MDGVLLLDKPKGPTSHDLVVWARRVTGERSVGHAGTLDPMASGLLVLLLGRATRLAPLLSGSDKAYEGTVRLGIATDTDDAEGRPLAEAPGPLPSDDEIEAVLSRFRGTFPQRPPDHSAKKRGGRKAYDLARGGMPVDLAPVDVTVRFLERVARRGDCVDIRVTASAGFYVRALARDLGTELGCGAHLAALRRTASGTFDVRDAVSVQDADGMGVGLGARTIALSAALPGLRAVTVTPAGLKRAVHGNPLGPPHLVAPVPIAAEDASPIKVLTADGHLLALAQLRSGTLHPTVVLG